MFHSGPTWGIKDEERIKSVFHFIFGETNNGCILKKF